LTWGPPPSRSPLASWRDHDSIFARAIAGAITAGGRRRPVAALAQHQPATVQARPCSAGLRVALKAIHRIHRQQGRDRGQQGGLPPEMIVTARPVHPRLPSSRGAPAVAVSGRNKHQEKPPPPIVAGLGQRHRQGEGGGHRGVQRHSPRPQDVTPTRDASASWLATHAGTGAHRRKSALRFCSTLRWPRGVAAAGLPESTSPAGPNSEGPAACSGLA